jgi:hypothetical protein
MKSVSAVPWCLLVAACSSTDISRIPPFSSASHQSVQTVRTAYLRPLNEGLILGDGVTFLRKPAFELTDRTPEPPYRVLLPGTSLQITSVHDEILLDGRSQVAYGSTSLANEPESHFAYRWGFLDTLQRAPWEPSSVPDRRNWKQGEQGVVGKPAIAPRVGD